MDDDDDQSTSTLEAAGLAALDHFIETFNSRDAAAWAASLSFPHVRVSPRPAASVINATAEDYAAAVTYEAADAMGWHHSAWDTKQILAVSRWKIHASAQWCRYDAAGARILTNNVSYVITNIDGRWGIQARFGVDSPPPDDASLASETATRACVRLWQALGTRPDEIESLLRFPFHVVGTGAVNRVTNPTEVLAHLGAAAGSTEAGKVSVLQVGEQGVNVGMRLSAADGPTFHGLFLVSLRGAEPRVAAASLLPD